MTSAQQQQQEKAQLKRLVDEQKAQQEAQKLQVSEMELRARYFKALYEIRHYTVEASKIRGAYEEILESERLERQKYLEELKKTADSSEGQLKIEEVPMIGKQQTIEAE